MEQRLGKKTDKEIGSWYSKLIYFVADPVHYYTDPHDRFEIKSKTWGEIYDNSMEIKLSLRQPRYPITG